MPSQYKSCVKDNKCNKKLKKCRSHLNNKLKKINHSQARIIYDCEIKIIDEMYPKKRQRKVNPKHSKCMDNCINKYKKNRSKKAIKSRLSCFKDCHKTHQRMLLYKYGKLVKE